MGPSQIVDKTGRYTADVNSAGELLVSGLGGDVSGLATAGKQDTGNTSLASVDGKLPALVNSAVPTVDSGPAWTTVWGVSGVPYTSANLSGGVASVTDAPTSGQKLVIDDILISVDTAMSVTFKIETAGTVIYGPFYLSANQLYQFTPRGKGRKLATANKKLQAITSVAGNIMIDVSYHSEA